MNSTEVKTDAELSIFKVTQDLEERARLLKMRMNAYRQSGTNLPASDTEATHRTRTKDRIRQHGLRDRPDRSYDRTGDVERNHIRRRGRGRFF